MSVTAQGPARFADGSRIGQLIAVFCRWAAVILLVSLVHPTRGFSAEPPPKTRSTDSPTQSPPQQSSETSKQPRGQSLDELLLFHPWKYPRGVWNPSGLKYQEAWFTSEDGTRLYGWYCPAVKPRAVMLFAHGNGGNLTLETTLLKTLQQRLHASVFIFDYRGYGRSDGVPTVAGVIQDARAARKRLAVDANVRETEIVLMGRSLGGAIVAELAADLPPRGLVIESSFTSLHDVAEYHYPKLAWLVPADRLNSQARLSKYPGPIFISHGDADQVVPFSQGQKLFESAQGPKKFLRLPRGGHNDARTAEYIKQLDRFLTQLPVR